MKFVVVIMTGIGFTLGVIFGICFNLPVNSLPADENFIGIKSIFRYSRNLRGFEAQNGHNNIGVDSGVNGVHSPDKIIPSRSSDQAVDLGGIVSDVNNMGRKDLGFLDFKGNYPTRNSDHVQREGEKGKQETHSGYTPEGGIDSIASEGKQPVSLTVVVKSNSKVATALEGDFTPSTKDKSTGSNDQVSGLTSMTSGIHWTRQLENACPDGFSKTESDSWRTKTKSSHVVKLEEGCGRMQNRLATFDDASKACVRYRLNTDQIQGEIYSYYLAKLLNMTNLPPSILHKVDRVSEHWKNVHLEISDSQWTDGKVVVFTQFINNLSPGYIPERLRPNSRRLHPTDDIWRGKPLGEVCDLLQWSDLIVFDYLTANLDRMVNNMFNKQWNEQMMSSPAHNLEKTPNGKLVFLDNESGLFHGYRLLDKYAEYHSSLLTSVCVFRRSTTEAVKQLYKSDNIGSEIHKLFAAEETYHSSLPQIPRKNIKILQQRLKDVYKQIIGCERQYGQ